MAHQHTHTLSAEHIPDVTVVVVMAREEKATRDREGDRGDTTENVVVSVNVHFPVGTKIKEAARRIIRASRKSITAREEPRWEQDVTAC